MNTAHKEQNEGNARWIVYCSYIKQIHLLGIEEKLIIQTL